jgi:hypothetical protein
MSIVLMVEGTTPPSLGKTLSKRQLHATGDQQACLCELPFYDTESVVVRSDDYDRVEA